MARTNFSKRFRELVKDLSDTELGFILGVSADAARKMRNGDIKSLKLHAALKLARELQISPWYLAAESEPEAPKTASVRLPDKRRSRTPQECDENESTLPSLAKRITRLERLVRRIQSSP